MKIVAGGLPGGAVVGKEAIMSLMTPREDEKWNRSNRVTQNGTFNANPITAAAAIATLDALADGMSKNVL